MSVQDANSVTLTGYVVADPDFKKVGEKETELATFDVAVQGSYEKTSFFQIKYWGNMAVRVNNAIKKGSRVVVYGRMEQEKWKDKDDNARSTIVIVGSGFEFLRGGAKKKEGTSESAASDASTGGEEGKDIDFK